MAQITDSLAPEDTRDQCYRLLSERAPQKVLIDTDLKGGAWYIVRAPHEWERQQLTSDMLAQSIRPAQEL